jgi:hypothetical protein
VAVMSKGGHGRAVTGHVAVAGDVATHVATQGRVVGEEAGVVFAPHKVLLVSELDVGECLYDCTRHTRTLPLLTNLEDIREADLRGLGFFTKAVAVTQECALGERV